jgi:GTP-binding protein EngB required for normal cell division
MEDFMCNVLVMGKTGTGKSTLLNYICDANLAQTGTGKPVTGEGIYDYVVKINNQDVRIYDSWGIEAGKVDRWKELISKSLKDHGAQKSIQDWFHSVIYCIQAGGGRVEDIDVEIIRQFLSDGYKITIVLTKADQVDENEEATMKKVISSELCGKAGNLSKRLNIVATCAEKKITRSGETHPFGKEEVCNAILDGWRDTILERLPKHVIALVCELLQTGMECIKSRVLLSEISGVAEDNSEIFSEIQRSISMLTRQIEKEIFPRILKEAAESCHKANLSLKAMLNTSSDSLAYRQLDRSMPRWAERPVISVLEPIEYVIRKITDFFKARSEENIAQERQRISDYIDQITNELVEKYQAQEHTIAKQLRQSLEDEM